MRHFEWDRVPFSLSGVVTKEALLMSEEYPAGAELNYGPEPRRHICLHHHLLASPIVQPPVLQATHRTRPMTCLLGSSDPFEDRRACTVRSADDASQRLAEEAQADKERQQGDARCGRRRGRGRGQMLRQRLRRGKAEERAPWEQTMESVCAFTIQ